MIVFNILTYVLFFSIFVTSRANYEANKDDMTLEETKYRHDIRRTEEKSIFNTKETKLGVIAGIQDTSDKFPYAVAIGIKPKLGGKLSNIIYPDFMPYCTGNLISAQWVLSAAHCMRKRNVPIRIRYGNFMVPPNDTLATYSEVLKMIQHPSYYSYGKNDIGLLLITKAQLSVYGRISAVESRTLVGLPVVYAGIGRNNASGQTPLARQLQRREYGEAVVMPCPKFIVSSPVICLASKCSNKAQQAFRGDSGGPLLHAGRIVGVCHGGAQEMPFVKPTVMYMSVSPFLDWISTTLRTLSP